MNNHRLFEQLQSLGLAKAEALVYIAILLNPNNNGSQITKLVDLPKPSVYLALDKLYQKGLINLIPGKSKQYTAQDPKIAFKKIAEQFSQNINATLKQLEQIKPQHNQGEFIHIKGFSNFISQIKQILLRTTKEVYIHTNLDLNVFQKEIQELNSKGIRIILYSFGENRHYSFTLEEYHNTDKPNSNQISMLLVADYQESIMSSGIPDENYLSIYTKQKLQINILSEHIHNDIYWHKLYTQKGKVEFDCELNSIAEDINNI